MSVRLLPLGVLLLLTACAARTPIACPGTSQPRQARVLFATDRKPASTQSGFTGDRTDPPALQMGWETIALGARHRLGLLDTAVAVAPAQVQEGASAAGPKHQQLYTSDDQIRAYVRTTLRAAIHSSPAPAGSRKQVLLFVHGYNSSFDWSVRKTAQLAADLQMIACDGSARGVPVAYSWPSQASLIGYLADEENAEWTQQRMVPFLEALAAVTREEGAELQIVAHSMGSRVVVRSLAQIAGTGGGRTGVPLAANVILLAPDISRPLFDQYFARFVGAIGHLTIYVSSKDHALAVSGLIHRTHTRLGFLESTVLAALNLTGNLAGLNLGDDHRELGVSVERASATRKIDMIDVSSGLADPLGHSYEDPKFIADLRELIYHHTPPGIAGRNNLEPRQVGASLLGLHNERVRYFRLRAQ
jgi:esterase/lipase superfamily enzyme